jgi:hypothetical protein
MRNFGIDHESFDQAYPHELWEQIDWFEGKDNIQYVLWKGRAPLDPPAMICTASMFGDELHWAAGEESPYPEALAAFQKLRTALGVKPPPAPPPKYQNHPYFGRF